MTYRPRDLLRHLADCAGTELNHYLDTQRDALYPDRACLDCGTVELEYPTFPSQPKIDCPECGGRRLAHAVALEHP